MDRTATASRTSMSCLLKCKRRSRSDVAIRRRSPQKDSGDAMQTHGAALAGDTTIQNTYIQTGHTLSLPSPYVGMNANHIGPWAITCRTETRE